RSPSSHNSLRPSPPSAPNRNDGSNCWPPPASQWPLSLCERADRPDQVPTGSLPHATRYGHVYSWPHGRTRQLPANAAEESTPLGRGRQGTPARVLSRYTAKKRAVILAAPL